MGQYVIVEHGGKYCFNLCASDGHVLATSIVFPSRDECMRGIEDVRTTAKGAQVEDSTVDAFARESSPKFRIYEDMDGLYYFRFITGAAGDIAVSHHYPKKDSLLRRIERMRTEAESSMAAPEE